MFNIFSNKLRGSYQSAYPRVMKNGDTVALIYNPPDMFNIFRGIVLIGPNTGVVLKIGKKEMQNWKDYNKSVTFIGND